MTIIALGTHAAEYQYTVGDESLGAGNITFKYEGDAIVELRMSSDENETLTLTGDDLVFADGAKIITGQNSNVIENGWTANGALEFGKENLSWVSATPLSKTDYVTLFTGVSLADISPVEANGYRTAAYRLYECKPYYVQRNGDTMTAEFQGIWHYNNGRDYVASIKVEFKQVGADIAGRVVGSGHFGANNTDYLGWNMFDAPTVSVSTYDFYMTNITVGVRREMYDYTNGLLTTSFDTVVARNVRVEELEILYGGIGYAEKVGTYGRATMKPRHERLIDGVLSAQMVWSDTSTRTKCVKVELKQSGSDVVARAVYCRLNGTTDENFDFDDASLKKDGANPTGWEEDRLYTTYDTSNTGSGIDMLVLRRKSLSRVAFRVAGEKTLGAVSGSGTEVAFEAVDGGATISAVGANTMTDSAYVIKGDSQNKMIFKANNGTENPLPSGTTDVWGEGTEFQVAQALKSAQSAITMHPGSLLDVKASLPNPLCVVLDGATCRSNADRYLSQLTFTNASTVEFSGGKVRACYTATDCEWVVSGTGASTCNATLGLYGGRNSAANQLTIAVEDTVPGDSVDFIVTGDINANATYPVTSFVKTGAGTMRVDGSMTTLVNLPVRVAGGTLAVNSSNAFNSEKSAISLEGGTISFMPETANSVAHIALAESSGIYVGTGASLAIGDLTMSDDVDLAVNGDVFNCNVKVNTPLDARTLSHIRLNGKRAVQTSDGSLCPIGFMVIFQ